MSNYILGLDIGSYSIRAMIVNTSEKGFLICGLGETKTTGIKKGVVTNIEQAANAIKQAINEAIKISGVTYDKVIVSVSGSYAKFVKSQGVITIPGKDKEITIDVIKRAMQMAEHNANPPKDHIKLHVLPYDFKVDDQEHVEDPLGMSGARLEVSTHIITVAETSLRNLKKAVEMVGIEIDNLVLSGYASSISTLTEEEKQLGVALIDMGGSTSDLIVHCGNSLVYNSSLPIGSSNITNDISEAVHTKPADAEEVKLNFSKLISSRSPSIKLPELGESSKTQDVSLEMITDIIYSRVEETLMFLANQLDRSGYKNKCGAGLVLTGGGAKLRDIASFASKYFGMSVRIAKPKVKEISGLYEKTRDCSNSCVIGLCLYGAGEFTPYEVDSNGKLRHKDEEKSLINKEKSIAQQSNKVPENIEKLDIDEDEYIEPLEAIDEYDDEIPIDRMRFEEEDQNIVKKFWTKLTQLF